MNFLRKLFFNFSYLRRPPWDTGEPPPELIAFIQQHQPGKALDLGCGTGTNSITLANYGWHVTGVDFAPRAIKKAKRKIHKSGLDINFRHDDVTRLNGINGPFDLILDIGCFHSLSYDGKIVYGKNIRRLLAENGTYLMYAFFRVPGEPRSKLGSGLIEEDLDLLAEHLTLVKRQDGVERGLRPSAWFWYKL